ncbi:hypothetical protein OH76DRAFT_1401692 [Lentinus brumalis]|uniref:Uncharacterized protein n=1 Tax=Lentinus brumalis TaxID=2498619 RepID=A0A371DFP8_9APHY|nr:hypothetical protein OH76DRAFT_1401692 [Polyporus brumalis]
MGSWRVEFEPTTLLVAEQPAITTAVTTAHTNVQALQAARYAVVYSAGGVKWWHTGNNDNKEHVTARFFDANRQTRVHVYRDGSASIRPTRTARAVAAEDDGTLSPFTDEEVETGGK